MSPQRSNFALNVLALLFFGLIFSFLKEAVRGPDYIFLRQLFEVGASICGLLFSFGLLYALFRLADVKIGPIEAFYQKVPVGWMGGSSHDEVSDAGVHEMKSQNGFDWHKLLSFQYLRFVGVLLIILSIFSLFFNIDWSLRDKVILAAAFGVILLGAAEMLLRFKKVQFASMSSLFGFALLQFACTLAVSWLATLSVAPILQDAGFWLAVKTILTLVCLYSVFRYPSSFQGVAYFLIAYSTPFTLLQVDALPSLLAGGAYVLVMTGLLLWQTFAQRNPGIALVNIIGAGYAMYLFQSAAQGLTVASLPSAYVTLIVVSIVFLMHIATALAGSLRAVGDVNVQRVHIIVAHVFMLLFIHFVSDSIVLIDDYIGIAYLAVAAVTFITYMCAHMWKTEWQVQETLINLAIIISSVGLFIQVEGPWTAIVFLSYSCLLLWYCLFNTYLRTRIYAFVVLTASLFKLFVEFSDIFSSISGTVATMIVGIVLVALSFKFEAIKDLVLKGGGEQQSA